MHSLFLNLRLLNTQTALPMMRWMAPALFVFAFANALAQESLPFLDLQWQVLEKLSKNSHFIPHCLTGDALHMEQVKPDKQGVERQLLRMDHQFTEVVSTPLPLPETTDLHQVVIAGYGSKALLLSWPTNDSKLPSGHFGYHTATTTGERAEPRDLPRQLKKPLAPEGLIAEGKVVLPAWMQVQSSPHETVLCYLQCDSREGNLHVGFIRWDAELNVVSNQLTALEVPADKVTGFNMNTLTRDGNFYLVLREMVQDESSTPSLRTVAKQQKEGTPIGSRPAFTLYSFSHKGLLDSFSLGNGIVEMPAIFPLPDGNVLLAGFMTVPKSKRYSTAWNKLLNPELRELATHHFALEPDMLRAIDQSRSSEPAMQFTLANVALYDMSNGVLLHAEVEGATSIEGRANAGTTSRRFVSGAHVFLQIGYDGKYTGAGTIVSKMQSEGGQNRTYTGALLGTWEGKLHLLFNDHPENLTMANAATWTLNDLEKGGTVIRHITLSSDLVREDYNTPEDVFPVALLPRLSVSFGARALLMGGDRKSWYGALMTW